MPNWRFWEVQIRFKPAEKEGGRVGEQGSGKSLLLFHHFRPPASAAPARTTEGGRQGRRLITQAIPESRAHVPACSATQKIHERVLKMKAGRKEVAIQQASCKILFKHSPPPLSLSCVCVRWNETFDCFLPGTISKLKVEFQFCLF